MPETLPSPATDPHGSIAAVLQYLMVQHERGHTVDMMAVLTVLAALNELCAARPQSLAASVMLRQALGRLGAAAL